MRHEWTDGGKRYLADDADGGRLGGTPPSLEEAPAAAPDYADQLHRGRVMRAAAGEILRLAEENRQLRAAGEEVLVAFDKGVYVRDIGGDDRPDWAMRAMPHLLALGRFLKLIRPGFHESLTARESGPPPKEVAPPGGLGFCDEPGA